MTSLSTDEPVQRLDAEECWELLEGEELGRLAYRLVDEVHIVPINYVVDGRSLLFRTSSGNKLLAAGPALRRRAGGRLARRPLGVVGRRPRPPASARGGRGAPDREPAAPPV